MLSYSQSVARAEGSSRLAPQSSTPSPHFPLRTRPLGAIRMAAAIAALTLGLPLSSHAATGTVLYQGMTLPSGLVKVGNDYWVSDHVFGFCKLVAGTPGYVDQNYCNTAQISPGQAAVKEGIDPSDGATVTYAYVPDNATKGTGVWRHTIKNGYVLNSVLLPNGGINGNRPMAVAMGPDGHLYVSLGRNNTIMRIRNPDPSHDQDGSQVAEKYGTSSVKVGPPSLTFIGNTLYLAENTGITSIPGTPITSAATATTVLGCGSSCAAKTVTTGVGAPVFVASDSTNLYIADLGNAYRYVPAPPGMPGCLKPLGAGYGNVASLALNPATATAAASLYVGDDPTAGASFFKGVVYGVDPNPAGDCVATGGATGGTGGTGGVGADPVPTSPATLSGPPFLKATLPGAIVQIGAQTWISDHLQGFCRLDTNGSLANCVTNAALAPGQAVAAPAPGSTDTNPVTYIYVPDTASKGLGVWRLRHEGGVITNAALLAPGALSGARASAVGFGPDHRLYVVSGKNNNILRMETPEAASTFTRTGETVTTTVETIGAVSGRGGPPAMTFRGEDIYFAEATGITTVPNAKACTKSAPCLARTFPSNVAAPVFVTSDGTYLYIADVSKAYRYTFSGTGPSVLTELGTGFATISSLGFTSTTTSSTATDGSTTTTTTRGLLVGDDTTAGTSTATGRIWNLDITKLNW